MGDSVREDPGLNENVIAAALAAGYGLRAESIVSWPVGFDFQAAIYRIVASDGEEYFLKVHFGPFDAASLRVPRAAIDRGIDRVLAPLRALTGDLSAPLDAPAGSAMALYPFVPGRNAAAAGLSGEQWRTFGATLRAIHDSDLAEHFRGLLPAEDFALPAAIAVRRVLDHARTAGLVVDSPAAAQFAGFLRGAEKRTRAMLAHVEDLGRALQMRRFERVLCHGDIHAANILVGDDGQIRLIDWDGPLLAPRERDLLFTIGSVIARRIEPREETRFFAGYGPVVVDPEALIYYRYERIVQDLGEIGYSVLRDPNRSDAARADEAQLAMGFFAPGGEIDRAEIVDLARVPLAT
ncbi:MAG: aminoglycoside phosphotransferase family protein [Thermomicrobiales bacterium]|nr:aminoglycoside phosphotransferase family protein [Thermomicrobiales bacterium]